jgi:prepilin-type processing-associated H-X9-DG protein
MGIPTCVNSAPNLNTPFICPSGGKVKFVDISEGRINTGLNAFFYSSYVLSAHLAGARRSKITKTFFFVYDGYYGETWGTITFRHDVCRHGNAMNMLFTDGHVDRLTYSEFHSSPVKAWY